MKRFVVTSVLLLTLVLASPSAAEAQARRVLQPSELCSDHSDAAIATFEDADLEAAVRRALSIGAQEDLTCGLVSGLTGLAASGPGPVRTVTGSPRFPPAGAPFESLVGIQNLTGLTSLTLNNKSITDVSALSGLTNLTVLRLHTNWISDISALSGLTKLTDLFLSENSFSDISALSGLSALTRLELTGNSITDISALSGLTSLTGIDLRFNAELTDIQPLLDNLGLGAGDRVELRFTRVSCSDAALLEAKGVMVHNELFSPCP